MSRHDSNKKPARQRQSSLLVMALRDLKIATDVLTMAKASSQVWAAELNTVSKRLATLSSLLAAERSNAQSAAR